MMQAMPPPMPPELMGRMGMPPGMDPTQADPMAGMLAAAEESALQEVTPEYEGEEVVNEIKDPTGGQAPIIEEVHKKDTSKDFEVTVKEILDIFESYKDARAEVIESAWQISEELYDGIVREAVSPHLSLYEIREIYKQCEGKKARSFQAFFGGKKRFEYEAEQEGAEEAANEATHAVRKLLKTTGSEKQMFKWHDQVHHVGTSFLQYDWARFKRIRYKQSQLHDVQRGFIERDIEEVLAEGPWFEHVDVWKCYANPWVEEIEESPFFFKREIVSGEYLRTLVNEGKFDEDAVAKALDESGGAEPGSERPDRNINRGAFGKDEHYELLQCWTSVGWQYAVVGGKHLVMAQRNPYGRIPFFMKKTNPRAGMLYGISEPMVLEAEQKLLRDIASLWVDTIYYKLQPMFVVNEGLRGQFEQLAFVPGETLYVNNKDDVQDMPTKAETFQLQAAMEYVRQGMGRTGGENDENSGFTKHRTSSGIMQLREAGAAREEHQIALWTPVYEEVYATAYGLCAAFLNSEVETRVEGIRDGLVSPRKIVPSVFFPDVEVSVIVGPMLENPAELQTRMITAVQVMKDDPRWNFEYMQEQFGKAFEFPHPKRLIAARGNGQQDAMYENEDFLATGYIAPPSPFDEDQVHYYIHELFKQGQKFLSLLPEQQGPMLLHCAQHQRNMELKQAGMGQQQLPLPGAPQMPGPAAGNALANGMLNMGARGAMQQGVPLG